eukprot:m.466889 g.466889  ORF g.466889 m.466889 type:complete len:52 (+) comp20363_c0_seq5:336-491(+)
MPQPGSSSHHTDAATFSESGKFVVLVALCVVPVVAHGCVVLKVPSPLFNAL